MKQVREIQFFFTLTINSRLCQISCRERRHIFPTFLFYNYLQIFFWHRYREIYHICVLFSELTDQNVDWIRKRMTDSFELFFQNRCMILVFDL